VEFRDQKHYLFREAVRNGWESAAQFPAALTQGLPSELPKKWLAKFYRTPKIEALSRSTRLVNRFMVGADPEFTLADGIGKLVHANTFKLHVGLAFGADLAGRPVELRPAPSRFALDVLASILTELRWMALTVPKIRECQWFARPYVEHDGIGGHVHFGRKRLDKRDREVNGLDRLASMLTALDVFDRRAVQQRNEDTVYGKFGDVRDQAHGYEYRTLPTWLSSPWLAYLTLVLSKLAVYDPMLIEKSVPSKGTLRNLLAFYKGLDDDAMIAYAALERFGWPKQDVGDFKSAWGLTYPKDLLPTKVLIPEVIEPTDEDRQQIFNLLVKGTPIPAVVPKPNWGPTTLPEGYYPLAYHSDTTGGPRRRGFGELMAGLAHHENAKVRIETGEGDPLRILHPTGLKIPREFSGTQIKFYPNEEVIIYIGQRFREDANKMVQLKKFLLEHFPVWKFADVKPDSFKEFKTSSRVNLRGKEVMI